MSWPIDFFTDFLIQTAACIMLSLKRNNSQTRDVNKAGSFKAKAKSLKAKARSLKAKAKARDQG